MVTPTWEAETKKSKLDRKDQSSLSPNQTRSTDYKDSKKSYNESKKVPRVTRRVKNTTKNGGSTTTASKAVCVLDVGQIERIGSTGKLGCGC